MEPYQVGDAVFVLPFDEIEPTEAEKDHFVLEDNDEEIFGIDSHIINICGDMDDLRISEVIVDSDRPGAEVYSYKLEGGNYHMGLYWLHSMIGLVYPDSKELAVPESSEDIIGFLFG